MKEKTTLGEIRKILRPLADRIFIDAPGKDSDEVEVSSSRAGFGTDKGFHYVLGVRNVPPGVVAEPVEIVMSYRVRKQLTLF